MQRRFAIIGHLAPSSGKLNLNDLAGGSGRMDVLVRAVNAALFVSHGIRRDTDITLDGISIHVLDAEGDALETLEDNENLGFILSDHLPFSETDNQQIVDFGKISLGEKWLQGHACITIIQHALD